MVPRPDVFGKRHSMDFDIVVIGAGIAGATAAAHLSPHKRLGTPLEGAGLVSLLSGLETTLSLSSHADELLGKVGGEKC